MLEKCKDSGERWGGVSKILEGWLQQRQELIVEFCTVSGVHELASNSSDPDEGLQRFCELMVDYVSAGHFEVYDQLIQEAEEFGDSAALDFAKKIYPQISTTTEKVLQFNDALDGMLNREAGCASLAHELSLIGETLVARFELEDQLVEQLHYSHKSQVVGA
ncbi:MAG: sigma D regulator [Gammaproteobacteria bacterium]|nr:sigma D regulator [Gammaproteobacteria bacterium]NND38311.1 sigma D regulator [Pseudomonadales bacterium]MBT8150954.1 sigma D regulator [Gammaproteobacteria bacterium]NNL11753.1 sigma D regulator [Pseudomonadales bacterium]NNM11461.1 sigma D regulator [Pseudomonadales bacterium]